MKKVFPDYNNGLVNVISSIEKYFNVKNTNPTLKDLDKVLNKTSKKNVVLVLFDGLGYNILKRNEKYCPFLNKYLVKSILSCFPTTTMTARTTVESGLCPIEHGWLGWDMYFKKYDKVITLARNYVKGTKEKITNYNIAKTLLKYEPVIDKISKRENQLGSKVTYYPDKGPSIKKARKRIKNITKNGLKNYIYFYCNEPDHTFHKYGCDSKKAIKVLKKLDKNFKKLCNSLDDTIVIALADHGHLNIEYLTLTDYPNIIKMLEGNVSIDIRACSFMVKKEYKKTFSYELKKVLKDDFIIMSKKDIISKKLYGNGKENEYFKDGIGDYIAIATSNKAIRYDNSYHMHKSGHSGITEDEMLVPLIIYCKD